MDLTEFAESRPTKQGRPCWTCSLPERAEIDAAKRDRTVSVPQIIDWLVEVKGYDPAEARRSRLENHFQSGHHKL